MDTRVTMADVSAMAEILAAAQGNRRVIRLIDGVRYNGQARRICDTFGGSAVGVGTDMRDLALEVTLDGLGDLARWPVRELIRDIECHEAIMDAH